MVAEYVTHLENQVQRPFKLKRLHSSAVHGTIDRTSATRVETEEEISFFWKHFY
jgi:hypothetical protein